MPSSSSGTAAPPDLQEQAAGPVANPIEMGANRDDVPGKLKADKEYVSTFAKLYPEGITKASITDAIATFEKTLVHRQLPLRPVPARHRHRADGGRTGRLSSFQRGWLLYMSTPGQVLGGKTFEKFGRYGNYYAERGYPTPSDDGRFSVTKKESDRHKFKVPTLRNIAITFPYLHDGSTSDLNKVVKLMGQHQLHTDIPDRDVALVVSFLKTLTGELDGKPLQ